MSTRLRSQLIWVREDPSVRAKAFELTTTKEDTSEIPTIIGTVPHEEAIALLHIGAEVEHALMVQYLYAAFSLNDSQADKDKAAAVHAWKHTILGIAREEMAHLVTVQNLLTLIGGGLCFERDDYPIEDEDLWPFAFELEPLSKVSLAKYVLAEAPSDSVIQSLGLSKEMEEIEKRVQAGYHMKVNRVGEIYDRVKQLFEAAPMPEGPAVPPYTDRHPFISSADIQSSSLDYQVSLSAWGLGYQDLLIETASNRKSAIGAIDQIAVQGEGSTVPAELNRSHFGKFLSVYRDFPDDGAWSPARPIATNPTTNPRVEDRSRRIGGRALPWAQLFNLRYRMLLAYAEHAFLIEKQTEDHSHSPRGLLISWTFKEMYNLRSLSEILMTLPLDNGLSTMAGPPFEMPYTLALPPRPCGRWRLHRDLLAASMGQCQSLLGDERSPEGYLRALLASDRQTFEQIAALIGA